MIKRHGLYGLCGLVGIGAVILGALPQVLRQLVGFVFLGQALELRGQLPFTQLIPVLFAVVAIEIPILFLVAYGIWKFYPLRGSNWFSDLYRRPLEGGLFYWFFIRILAEELLFRVLFLSVLSERPEFSGAAGFYGLAIAGNSLWAICHLFNFSDRDDWSVVRIVPQFIQGIFLSFLYLNFGLVGSLSAHLAVTAIAFASDVRQDNRKLDLIVAAVKALVALLSFLSMRRAMSEALVWLDASPPVQLPGWGTWDYTLLAVVVCFSLSSLMDLLMLDRADSEFGGSSDHSLIYYIFYSVFVVVLGGALFWGIDWLLAKVVEGVHLRVVIGSLVFCSLIKGKSLSVVSRSFFEGVPVMFSLIFISRAAGLEGATIIMFVLFVLYGLFDIFQNRFGHL